MTHKKSLRQFIIRLGQFSKIFFLMLSLFQVCACGKIWSNVKYRPILSSATWISGNDIGNQNGVYGVQGLGSTSNIPGARSSSISWADLSGNLWLFGGSGYDSVGGFGLLNDLWKYQPSSGKWTWISGGNTVTQNGVYGTQGTGSTANTPGSRSGSMTWTDSSGDLWLFGGSGYDSVGTSAPLNDLWKYQPTSNQWTWVSGSNIAAQSGVYGSKGTGNISNIPGSRNGYMAWIDLRGDLWLFGGYGFDSAGNPGYLNDLWRYQPGSGQWTWFTGNNTITNIGIYGTQGTGSVANTPGSRSGSVTWADSSGNLWLFGGYGLDGVGSPGGLNDLWKYQPTSNQWTWVSGSNAAAQSGFYGTKNDGSISNIPGARAGGVSWIDSSGDLFLMGGNGLDSLGTSGALNDLWKYQPTSSQWTWISGSNIAAKGGVYGTKDIESTTNIPGGRVAFVSWVDSSGNFWLFGGYGYDVTGSPFDLNDLWEIVP